LPPARVALERIRAALTAFTPGMPFDTQRYRAALCSPIEEAGEADRLFCLGWLCWLESDWQSAESSLLQVVGRKGGSTDAKLIIEASYWLARVGLLLQRENVLAGYETSLRESAGWAQATAWYVDLLRRSGRLDRAEQILKTVRGNRRFGACDEVMLLEARLLLRRGDLTSADRLLKQAGLVGVVAQAERCLLLSWIAASQGRHTEASHYFDQVHLCLYPRAALDVWQRALARRAGASNATGEFKSTVIADYLRGQELRLAGKHVKAADAYRLALQSPAAAFSRYGLARMQADEFASILASQPGLFLALRCRAQMVVDRFLKREATPAECLDALSAAASLGYRSASADHYLTLASAHRQRGLEVEEVRALAQTPANEPAARRNLLRAAGELATRRLPPAEAASLLSEWVGCCDGLLRPALERQHLNMQLLAAVDAWRIGQSGAAETIRGLLAQLLDAPDAATVFPNAAAIQAAAHALAAEQCNDSTMELLRALPRRWQPLVRALQVYEAARFGNTSNVAGLLDNPEVWSAFGSSPPRFVIVAVEAAYASRREFAAWPKVLPRWLGLWQGTVSAMLSAQQSGRTSPPTGISRGEWYLPLVARALASKDYIQALNYLRQIPDEEVPVDKKEALQVAVPELERFARAQALAHGWHEGANPPVGAEQLVDAVDLLLTIPAGDKLLTAAAANDKAALRSAADELLNAPDLPGRLTHHLALLELRAAESLESEGQVTESTASYRRSWAWWLRFLADGSAPESSALLLEKLLGAHRQRINTALGRGSMDAARGHWEIVVELPGRCARFGPGLADDCRARVARFRDELATDFLLATREAMRQAPAAHGFRADYESGLTGLRRLLSLDRDNVRLLTALIEMTDDWLLDLYNSGSHNALIDQVERFTPFALQLGRLIENRPADLSARAALAGFTKFRGFVAVQPARKAELYREALRLNPADENVRELLAELDGHG
jgi:tetratricopeptide (TPR) repeat protein